MRLNLGCADRYAPGWVNVDYQSPYPMDQVVDLTGPLPWEHGSVDEVYVGHLLEHLELTEGDRLLERLQVCMVPGGQILVVGPDIEKAEAMIAAGTFDFRYHQLDSLKYGAHRWPGDEHRWECTGKMVMGMLASAGWLNVRNVGIENVDAHWPVADRSQLWQCAIGATA
jgi:predicted SAM-dependent methyltransferase